MHYNCIILFPSTNSTLLIQLHRFSDEKNLLISFSKIWTFLDTYLLWAKGRRALSAPLPPPLRQCRHSSFLHNSTGPQVQCGVSVIKIPLPSCFGSIDVIVAVNLVVNYGSMDLFDGISAWVSSPPLFLTLITMYPSSLHT